MLMTDDSNRRDFGQVWSKPYGRGWPAIRAAVLKRAGKACEIGCDVYRGPCTDRPSARLHVHHVGLRAYTRLWPALTYDDVQLLVLHAYRLAWQRLDGELESYLRANPELFPVVCAHHHSLFESGRNALEMLRVVTAVRPGQVISVTR